MYVKDLCSMTFVLADVDEMHLAAIMREAREQGLRTSVGFTMERAHADEGARVAITLKVTGHPVLVLDFHKFAMTAHG